MLIGDNTVMERLLVLHLVVMLKTLPLPKRLLTSFRSSPVLLLFLEIASPLLHLVLVTIGKCYLWISIIVANAQECILATVTVCLTLTVKRISSKNCHCVYHTYCQQNIFQELSLCVSHLPPEDVETLG